MPAPEFVTEAEGRAMAEKHGALFAATSAATGEGVRDVFYLPLDEYTHRWGLPDAPRKERRLEVSRVEVERRKGGGGWCCG